MIGRFFVKGSCPAVRSAAALASFVAVVLVASMPAHAQVYWSASSGDWSGASNWTGHLVPTGTDSAWIVNSGTATVTTMNATCGSLSLGSPAGSGTVQMTGGSLSALASTENVGYSGTGNFVQSGGTNNASLVGNYGGLELGYNAGVNGTYKLSGTGQLVAAYEDIGIFGTGYFTQSGGVNNAGSRIALGDNANSSGTYLLSGGLVSTQVERLGNGGVGTFTQSGGTNQVSDYTYGLVIGNGEAYSNGTYNLEGGLLIVSLVKQAQVSAFNFSGGTIQAGYAPSFATIWMPMTLATGGGGATFDAPVYYPLNICGSLSGPGTLTKVDSGTLTLAASNTYTGATTISGGILSLANSAALAGGGNITFGGGTLQFSRSNSQDYSARIVGSSGPIAIDTNGANVVFTSGLASSNTGGLTKIGSGTLLLTATNSFSGNTLVSSGTLMLGSPLALQNSTLDTSGAGTLSFGTLSAATVGGLTGPGTLGLGNGVLPAVALIVGNNSASTTFSGALIGLGSLTKVGSGTLLLTGSNSYTGATTINAGILQIGNGTRSEFLASPSIAVNNYSILVFNHADTLTYTGAINGNGFLDKQGSGTLILTNTSINAGWMGVYGGTLQVAAGGKLGGGDYPGSISIASGTLLDCNAGGTQTISGVISGSGTLADSNGDLTLSSPLNNSVSTLVINGTGRVIEGPYASALASIGQISVGAGGILVLSDAVTLSPTNSMTFSSGSGLSFRTVQGPQYAHYLTLNTTRQTFPSAGVMSFDNDEAATESILVQGNWPALTGNLEIQVGGGRNIGNAMGSVNLLGTISGPYSLTKNYSGGLGLSGSNTYSGGTTISGGTLQVAETSALGSGGLAINAGLLDLNSFSIGVPSLCGTAGTISDFSTGSGTTTLSLSQSVNTVFSGTIQDGPKKLLALIKSGGGTLALTGSNTYTGPTTVNQGSLLVNGSLASPVTVNSGGMLGGSGSLTSVTVASGGSLSPGAAPGAMTVSGSLSLLPGAQMDYVLDTPTDSDEVYMPSGPLVLSGQQFADFNFTALGGFGPGTYMLIDASSVPIGSLGTSTSGTIDGLPANIAIQGDDVVLTVVPEPGTLTLLGVAAVGLLVCAWRLRRGCSRQGRFNLHYSWRRSLPVNGTGRGAYFAKRRMLAATLIILGIVGAPAHAQELTVLYSFSGSGPAHPVGGLTISGNTLYGTTAVGGVYQDGTVFSIPVSGDSLTVLASFNGNNGQDPQAGLTISGNTLYGTTDLGGAYGTGEVFSLPVSGGSPTVLASFNNSGQLYGGLTLSGNILYGTTRNGGLGYGTVFSVPVSGGSATTLTSFNGSNGEWPEAGVIVSGSNLYGTTSAGGAYGYGEVFSLPLSGGSPTLLGSFPPNSGTSPAAGLTLSGNTLYGTTEYGALRAGFGTVFSLPITGGSPTVLANLNNSCGYPQAGLTLVGNTLYGTASGNSAINYGAVFSVAVSGGSAMPLATFNDTNGAFPFAGLVPSGTTLYGTTNGDDLNDYGTIFAMNIAPATITLGTARNATIITGGTGAIGMTVSNSPSCGYNLNYTVNAAILSGSATLGTITSGTGSLAPSASQSWTVSATSTNLGVNAISLTASDPNSSNLSQTATATLTVLDHAAAGFANGSGTLNLNFGTLQVGSGTQGLQFQIENLPAAYRAGLDLNSVLVLSDSNGVFSTDAAPFTDLAAGTMSNSFNVFLDTSQVGEFSGEYEFNLSDEQDLSGWAGQQTLTLNVTADVVPEPSTLTLLGFSTIGLVGYGLRRRAARTAKTTACDQQDAPAILSFPSHTSTAHAARRAA